MISSRIFRIIVNSATFRVISVTFETTFGFWFLLPVHKFRRLAPDYLIKSITNRLFAILQPYWPEYVKKSVPGALEAKPEVEIWRWPVSPTQRPRLPIRLRILYGVYLAPLRLHRERILTLTHCNGRGTEYSRLSHPKKWLTAFFFQIRTKFIWVTRVRFFLKSQNR